MKKIYLYTALGLATAMSGCNKYLDKEPDNRAKLNSPEKVSQLLATAYPQASYMEFAESISDNVSDRGNGGTNYESMDPYMFRDVRSNTQDSPEFYWSSCYSAIAAANQALAAIAAAPDSANYRAQKGEALVARAYAHFMLVNFFSKFYDPATAATDPGVPYVTEPETVVVKQYERKTVAYVYDMVEKDMLAGIPLLKDESYSVPAYHFTRAAAHAFAARYYLYKKDYSNVLIHTQEVIPTGGAANIVAKLRPWNTTYLNLTRLQLFAVYQKATEPANLLLVETISGYPRDFISTRYGFDPRKAQAFGYYPPVVNGEFAFGRQMYGSDNLVYVPKINEYFVRASVNADIGTIYMMAPLFTMEEALFNRAEALAYTPGGATEALNLINTYLSTRIVSYNPGIHTMTTANIAAWYGAGSDQANIVNLLLDLRQSEFIHEGMRWFDILRYKIPVTHSILVNGNSTTPPRTITLDANSKQRIFQIPQSATLSGVELNPR